MATANPHGPCVFCGKPAHLAVLVTLRTRNSPRRPTRIRICRPCRRTEFHDVPDAPDKASTNCPATKNEGNTQ